MTGTRSYRQLCPMAATLDVVGDRWALLVVRELLLGPRRFTELQQGLAGIGTDILTARLRGLEGGGVVRRTGAGRARRYELTERGRALRPVLVELARWGAGLLRLPSDPDEVTPRVALTSLLLDPPAVPATADGDYELRAGDERARLSVRGGRIAIAPAVEPATTIDLTRQGVRALLLGLRARQLVEAGDLDIRGDIGGARRLLDALSGPELLEGLRRRLAAPVAD